MRTSRRTGPGGLLPPVLAGLAVVALLLPGCATNPATGETQLALIGTQQEVRLGKQTAAQVQQTMGLYEHEQLGEYVAEIGMEMARDSERPDLPWSFEVVDEPVVNAFAVPGGYIYFTRGILAYFNSEAELAAVVGHEIGHVTARHSVERMSKQQLAQLGLGLGAVLSEEVRQLSGLLGAGLNVLFMSFSRDDERQADRLGFRYMLSHGYEPSEMVDVFQMFRQREEAAGGSGVPGWLSTHPTPESRIEEIRQMVDSVADQKLSGLRTGRDAYLRRIEGIVYGPNPRNGFFRGSRFVHPELEFRLDFPEDWQYRNMARMVAAVSPDQDAQMQLTLSEAGSPRAAAEEFAGSEGVEPLRSEETEINGFPAVAVEFRAQGGQQGQTTLRGIGIFLEDGSRVYSLLGVTAEQAYERWAPTFRRTLGSYDRLTDEDALDAQPLRLRLVTTDRETTIEQLASEGDSPVPASELALINALEPDERIPSGRTIKWVTGELPEAMREASR